MWRNFRNRLSKRNQPPILTDMEATTTFDPTNYNYDGAVIVSAATGTGHSMTCPETVRLMSEGEAFNAQAFSQGGFDLFCEHGCLDDIIKRREHPMVADTESTFTPGPKPKAAAGPEMDEGDEESLEDFRTFLAEAPAKLTNDDMTKTRIRYAKAYLDSYTGTFDFLLDLQGRKSLSVGQARGVANCMRAEVQREARQQAQVRRMERDDESAAAGLDISEVPSGYYAVPGGETRLKLHIKQAVKGKWAGWTFVTDGAEYGQQQRYGRQAPGSVYSGQLVEQLTAIAADPMAASPPDCSRAGAGRGWIPREVCSSMVPE